MEAILWHRTKKTNEFLHRSIVTCGKRKCDGRTKSWRTIDHIVARLCSLNYAGQCPEAVARIGVTRLTVR
jgi:hypothetical protein